MRLGPSPTCSPDTEHSSIYLMFLTRGPKPGIPSADSPPVHTAPLVLCCFQRCLRLRWRSRNGGGGSLRTGPAKCLSIAKSSREQNLSVSTRLSVPAHPLESTSLLPVDISTAKEQVDSFLNYANHQNCSKMLSYICYKISKLQVRLDCLLQGTMKKEG